jgi:hypothetical protein
MTTFLLGTNRFEECETVLAHQGTPVLRAWIEGQQLFVNLRTPDGTMPLHVEKNEVLSGDASVVQSSTQVSVIVDKTLVLHASKLEADEVLVSLELRPLGVAIYTDASGLHIGQSLLAGNSVRGARVAVALS